MQRSTRSPKLLRLGGPDGTCTGGKPGTIADIVLAGNADGPAFSENDLVMFVLGPYIAGLDTAANTAAFLFYELLSHPLLLEQVLAEIDSKTGLTTAERAELARFRKALRIVQKERDILKKAAASFAKQSR